MHKINNEVVINRDNIIDIFGLDIKKIDLSSYVINKIESHCFSNFNNLEIIKLGNKNLKIIEPFSFINCEKLREINIIGTKILELNKNTFYKLPRLVSLRLYNCLELQSIFPGFINKCNNFDDFYSYGCLMLGLYSNIFLKCKNINNIEINNSGILSLNRDTFSNLPNLQYLTINNNKKLCIIESGFINNCMKLEKLSMTDNKSLSSIDRQIIVNCEKLREIDLQNCNIQILHKNSFQYLYRLKILNIKNNSLLINYLLYETKTISDDNNLFYLENNFILDVIRDNLRNDLRNDPINEENNKISLNMLNWLNSGYLPEEPVKNYKFEEIYMPINIRPYLTHYEYCIKLFRLSPNRNVYFEVFMNLLSQIDKIDNSIIIKNIFIILFIIILFLFKINIYYDENSLEDNILLLLKIVYNTLSMKYVKNSLSLSENIPNNVEEYLDTNKYILEHKKIIIKIIGYLIDIYKGSSNFESTVTKFDSIMEYLYINNMKNKRKLKKKNIGRIIIDKRLELSYIIKEINESLELPKLKEGEIGLLLHYLKKLINFKKMKRINNSKEIQELSEHRNIQKKQLMRRLSKTKESINNTIINYYDKVSDMYIMKLLSNNIKHKINK